LPAKASFREIVDCAPITVRVLDYIGLPVKRLGVTDPCRVDRGIREGLFTRTATPVFDIAALKTAAPCSYMKPWRGGVTAAFWAASAHTTS